MTEQAWPIDNIGEPNDYGVRTIELKGGPFAYADDEELAAAGITPPPDPINIPTEMVAAFKEAWHKADSEGRPGRRVEEGLRAALRVHVPDAPSVRTVLHTIGLTDNDIAFVAKHWVFAEDRPTGKVVAAARAAENER